MNFTLASDDIQIIIHLVSGLLAAQRETAGKGSRPSA